MTTPYTAKADGGIIYAAHINAIQNGIEQIAYNVKAPNFGAVGDGVTDDTAALQGALDAINAAGSGVVFVPPGTYIHNGLEIYANTTLYGVPGLSILKLATNASVAATNDAAIWGSESPNVRIIDLTLDCNKANQADTSVDGIHLDSITRIEIRGCRIYNAQRHGISLSRGAIFQIINNEVYGCDGDQIVVGAGMNIGTIAGNICHAGGADGGVGIELEGRYLAEALSGHIIKYVNVEGNTIYDINGGGSHGILALNANYCTINNNVIFACRSSGIAIDGSISLSIVGNNIFDIGHTNGAVNGAGIAVLDELTGSDTRSSRLNIQNNNVVYTSKYGIYVQGNASYSHFRILFGGNQIDNIVTTAGEAAYACYGIYLDYVADALENSENIIKDVNTSGGGADRYYANDTWYSPWIETSIAAAPKWKGQRAIASAHTYTAKATSGSGDWLREDN